ncbi:urease accessory protein UreE [Prochlorococcus sp. AH-716-O13]|nr:urease accessory protein UreE [Prochlorococcus sp. AH-716-O13]
MSNKNQIVVIDWIKQNSYKGKFLKLTLSSDQRRIFRGRRQSDCNQEIQLQLPRNGKLNDGDILRTNHKSLFIQIIAEKENLLEITARTNLELIKVAYHLGNRHVEIEINENTLFTKSDYIIEDLLKNFDVVLLKVKKKFYPEIGAFHHEKKSLS